MELHLIRHPRTTAAPGICYGHSDVPLAEPVEHAASRLRPLLPEHFELHASPLSRAHVLAAALGAPRADPRLMELDFGDWEMQTYAQIGHALDAWVADPLGFRAPGGESVHDLTTRVLAWLGDTLPSAPARDTAQPLVVVAHGGPLRVIAGHLLGLPPERWLSLDFDFAHTTRLDLASWGTTLKWFNRY